MKYPWQNWFDGEVHILRMMRDFYCCPDSLLALARNASRRLGQVYRVRAVGAHVVLQAFAPLDPWLHSSDESLEQWHRALRSVQGWEEQRERRSRPGRYDLHKALRADGE